MNTEEAGHFKPLKGVESFDADQAMERLRESEERYRTLFELGPMAIYSCDSTGMIRDFNRRAVELWGREPKTGDTDQRFCGSIKLLRPDGSWMPHDQTPVAEVLSGKISEMLDAEVIIERPDGTRVTVIANIRPLKNERGEITGAINCFFDITERKQAALKIEQSEIRYRRLFEAAHDGILILDANTARVIDANRFMLDLLRRPLDYFLGKELCELGLFHDREECRQAMRQLQLNRSIRYENLPLQDRDGRQIPVEFVSNIYVENQVSVIQCNIRDISERKRFEDERKVLSASEEVLRADAEAANRAKDLFLATLSHEMRTPLTAIVGWISIMRSKTCDKDDLQEGLNVIERNTQAQVKLIEDVLDVSRIVSGKLRLEMRPCSLMEIIGASLEAVRPSAQARGITIKSQVDPEASRSTCDAARIQQAVWNLLANAIKFTPRGGSVGISLARENSSVRIQVTDNGQGIAAEFLPHVFDRFRQADNTTRRKHGGLGLGLSIVKHIVEMHGGTVEAQSAGEGQGSQFSFLLPVHAVQLDETNQEPGGTAGSEDSDAPLTVSLPLVRLEGLRVLVVDDQPDARRLLSKVLEHAGAAVTTAESAAEALELLPAARAEILISDLGMPEQDGFDLIRRVRELGYRAKELPAIALSGFANKEYQRQALLAGFQVHIPKPVDPHDLTAFISALAGRTG